MDRKALTPGPNNLVAVGFLDHSSSAGNDLGAIECVVFGIFFKEDDAAIYVSPWVASGDFTNHNTEAFCILKSTIQKIHTFILSESFDVSSLRPRPISEMVCKSKR